MKRIIVTEKQLRQSERRYNMNLFSTEEINIISGMSEFVESNWTKFQHFLKENALNPVSDDDYAEFIDTLIDD